MNKNDQDWRRINKKEQEGKNELELFRINMNGQEWTRIN